MQWNVVELASNGRYARLNRGFIQILEGDAVLGEVTIDEVSSLLLTAEQATLSKPLMVRLAEEGIPIIICGSNYHPIAITLPYGTHHQFSNVLQLQINASKPLNKQLWKLLVIQKIQHQQQALAFCHPMHSSCNALKRMTTKVRSGDPDNIEAQAARLYWQSLMGETFRRKTKNTDFANSALNYGYSILRGACARATVAAGLTPALGIHHNNIYNPFALVDDLMELFRPLVDIAVQKMLGGEQLLAEHKQALVSMLQANVTSNGQTTTVNNAMQNLAFSLVKSYYNKTVCLDLPSLQL